MALTLDQTAKLLKVSIPTLKRWIDLGLPVLKLGTNGEAYEIDGETAVAWVAERREQQRQAQDALDEEIEQLSLALGGGSAPTPEDGSRKLSVDERLKLVTLETATMKLAREKRELVPVFEVREVWSRLLLEARTQLLALPDRLAKHVDMSREQRTLVEQNVAEVLNALADGVKGLDVPGLEADPDGEREGAAGGAGGAAAPA